MIKAGSPLICSGEKVEFSRRPYGKLLDGTSKNPESQLAGDINSPKPGSIKTGSLLTQAKSPRVTELIRQKNQP
jgi:hypothetical protein